MGAKTILAIFLFQPYFLNGQYVGDGPKNAVIGSPHDLRKMTPGQSEEISACNFCHSMVSSAGINTLMWSTRTYDSQLTLYGRKMANVTENGEWNNINGGFGSSATLMCLGCHDGSTDHASLVRTPEMESNGGSGLGLLDLLADHPVHFVYNSQLVMEGKGLQVPVDGPGIMMPYVGRRTLLPLFKQSSTNESGYMECATCHNPHDGKAKYFLRMDNSGSALCLNCH